VNFRTLATAEGRTQKRAIFFVFEGGTGVGHLRRLAHVAKQLQGRFSCLIVTGHRAAAHWFVPEECEYIHLPSWDSLLESKAQYWGRKPFLTLEVREAIRLRKRILRGVVEAFGPDVMFVDHLPLGSHEELADIVRTTRCLKYFVTRGFLNETANPRLILEGKARDYLKEYYDRILVTLDRKIFDFPRHYNISSEISEKTISTGYVVERVPQHLISRIREGRGLEKGDIWVVASAGGGQLGEALIEGCLELAGIHKQIVFDIVLGPRSNLRWEDRHRSVITRDNLRLHKEVSNMPHLNASADLVISSGGYNSLLEALQGSARILCFPTWKDHRDEQYHHATCLKKFVDLEVSTDLSELPAMFERAIGSVRSHDLRDRREELDFNGTTFIEKILLGDLQM
jgi:predicted glycosyltransferase